jgi:phosphatidylglycerol:prolipoprotein diacylglycerol transferase
VPFPNISPIALELGPFVVRWYALAYLAGVFVGAWYGSMLLKRRDLWPDDRPPFEPGAIYDFAFWAVLGIVVGGRLGYVVFYNLPYFVGHPGEIIALWDGGMSFHGGLVGILLAMAFFTRARGGRILSGFDLLGAIGTIGLFLGRIANFINGELYGAPTTLPWAVVFPNDPEALPRHPSQLYEALLEGVILFTVIAVATYRFKALKRPGLVGGMFALGYALARILVEFVRLPDVQIGYFFGSWGTMGQLLSLPILVVGLVLIIYAARPHRA